MASTFKSAYVLAAQPPVTGDAAGDDVTVRYSYSLSAALVVNDIIYMGDLPPNHVPARLVVDSDDLDTNGTPTIVLQAGILNTALTDIDTTKSGGTEWLGTGTVAQAGGTVTAAAKSFYRVPVDDVNQLPMGIKVSTAPATGTTSGTIGFTITYRPTVYNV